MHWLWETPTTQWTGNHLLLLGGPKKEKNVSRGEKSKRKRGPFGSKDFVWGWTHWGGRKRWGELNKNVASEE